jgi:hypothetical protein
MIRFEQNLHAYMNCESDTQSAPDFRESDTFTHARGYRIPALRASIRMPAVAGIPHV